MGFHIHGSSSKTASLAISHFRRTCRLHPDSYAIISARSSVLERSPAWPGLSHQIFASVSQHPSLFQIVRVNFHKQLCLHVFAYNCLVFLPLICAQMQCLTMTGPEACSQHAQQCCKYHACRVTSLHPSDSSASIPASFHFFRAVFKDGALG